MEDCAKADAQTKADAAKRCINRSRGGSYAGTAPVAEKGQSGTIQVHTGFDRNLRPRKAIGRDPPGPSEGVALTDLPSYLHNFKFMMCSCIVGLQCEFSDLAT